MRSGSPRPRRPRMAKVSGVARLASRASVRAPCSTSRAVTFACPRRTASCNAVRCCRPAAAFTSAPALRRARMHSTCPDAPSAPAAMCSSARPWESVALSTSSAPLLAAMQRVSAATSPNRAARMMEPPPPAAVGAAAGAAAGAPPTSPSRARAPPKPTPASAPLGAPLGSAASSVNVNARRAAWPGGSVDAERTLGRKLASFSRRSTHLRTRGATQRQGVVARASRSCVVVRASSEGALRARRACGQGGAWEARTAAAASAR